MFSNNEIEKDSLIALANSLIRSALPAANGNEFSFLNLQQEATNTCIAGMTMAVLMGSNKKQIINLGLQSAGCAVANLAGERLGSSIVASHLALQQARATQSTSNNVSERAPAAPNAQKRRQAPAQQTFKQIQRPPRPNRVPPARPTVAENPRCSGLVDSDFERELNEALQTMERLTLNLDVANALAETSGDLRETPTQNHIPQTNVEPFNSKNTLLWSMPNRLTERSFPVSNNLQSLATVLIYVNLQMLVVY